MKNAESIMAAFLNCCLVEKNNLFTKTLFQRNFENLKSESNFINTIYFHYKMAHYLIDL